MSFNLYSVLGVDENADLRAIRAAYRKRAKAAHPDMPTGSDALFQQIKLAYDILSDEKRRARYDATGDMAEVTPDQSQSLLYGVLAQVMEGLMAEAEKHDKDPAGVDVVAGMRNVFEKGIQSFRERIDMAKRRTKSYKRILKRFRRKSEGENVMETIIVGRMAQIERDIIDMGRNIELNQRALGLLADFEFDWDRSEMQRAGAQQMAQLAALGRQGTSSTGWSAL